MELNPRQKRKKLVFFVGVVVVIFLSLYGLRFESFQTLYSSFPDDDNEFNIIKTRSIGQGFELEETPFASAFNGISIAVFNPDSGDVLCTFSLKTQKDGQVIRSKEFIVQKETDRFNIETIFFPSVQNVFRKRFYFELKSKSPFFIVESPLEPKNTNFSVSINKKSSKRLVLFRVDDREMNSIISHLFNLHGARFSFPLFLLILSSFLFLCLAGWMASRLIPFFSSCKKEENNQSHLIRSHVL
ncbi:MAG: hypothetical protein MUP98_20145, partial [Candidatus Aminicenantes bacterium]|nr:hypothetical protein [Candidatus Aminicenantes bacterium]